MKFGEGRMGRWTSKLGKGVHGCGLWRDICMGWVGRILAKNTRWLYETPPLSLFLGKVFGE